MGILKTTTSGVMDVLQMYAAVSLKEAAEKVIAKRMEEIKKEVSSAVYAEVEKISIEYRKFVCGDTPYDKIEVIIDDRRKDK